MWEHLKTDQQSLSNDYFVANYICIAIQRKLNQTLLNKQLVLIAKILKLIT